MKHILLSTLIALTPVASFAETISGKAWIVDGDTLKISGQSIRLHGIDAVESKQTCTTDAGVQWACGQAVKTMLIDVVKGKTVDCVVKDTDRYQRKIAVCYLNDTDLNALVVRAGGAVAYTRYSRDYVEEEKLAKSEQIGIWSGNFIEPSKWRQKNK